MNNRNLSKLRAIRLWCKSIISKNVRKKRFEINWFSLNDVEWRCEVRCLTFYLCFHCDDFCGFPRKDGKGRKRLTWTKWNDSKSHVIDRIHHIWKQPCFDFNLVFFYFYDIIIFIISRLITVILNYYIIKKKTN